MKETELPLKTRGNMKKIKHRIKKKTAMQTILETMKQTRKPFTTRTIRERTDLCRSTVSSLATKLKQAGIITETKRKHPSKGNEPKELTMPAESRKITIQQTKEKLRNARKKQAKAKQKMKKAKNRGEKKQQK